MITDDQIQPNRPRMKGFIRRADSAIDRYDEADSSALKLSRAPLFRP